MGNILHVPLLGHSGSPRFPCHLQLPSAAIDLSIDVRKDDHGESESWKVSYTVDGSTCKLILRRHVDEDGNINALQFLVSDEVHLQNCFTWLIRKVSATDRLSCNIYKIGFEHAESRKTNRTVNAWGGFTDTTSYVYGRSGNRGGLIVEEWKKNSNDEPFTTLTLAHYFAFKKSTETDIGFSVVAKVRAYNDNDGKLDDLTVDGPEQHPASSLLYMFDEVVRTGIWKPNMCFHCVQNRKHLRRMLRQESDTEDSDGVPVPPRRASRQNAITVSNDGRFRDGSGNYFENIYMNFIRRWW